MIVHAHPTDIEHYKSTIKSKVDLKKINKFISDVKILNRLKKTSYSIWGIAPGPLNTKKFDKIMIGDICLMYYNQKFHTSGQIIATFNNHNFAKELWGLDKNKNGIEKTWEHMFVIDDLREINISLDEFNNTVKTQQGNYYKLRELRGFTSLNEMNSNAIIHRFPEVNASQLLEFSQETIFEESNQKHDFNLDYDVKDFNPDVIDTNPKKKNKKKSKKYHSYIKPSKKVGDAGENHVYDYERNKLLKMGRSDLADKIVKQFDDQSNYPGYDIQSFDEHGNKIYIEVKSTKTKKKSFFEISDNEVSSARKYGNEYHIYHVTNALINPKIVRIIKNPLLYVKENKILLEPWIYKLKFSDNQK